MPGFAFPTVGPLGLGSPPSRSASMPTIGTMLRYDCQLPFSGRFAFRSLPDTLPVLSFCVPSPARGQARTTISAPGLYSIPVDLSGIPARRPSALPSSRVTPVNACPARGPRWCPVCIALTHPGLLPSATKTASAFPPVSVGGHPGDHNYSRFRGSVTRPALSLPPASYTPLQGWHAGSLLTCWLGFGQVGLEPSGSHPLGNIDEFHEIALNPNVSDLSWHDFVKLRTSLRSSR